LVRNYSGSYGGKGTVGGADAFASYIVPGGMKVEQIKDAKNWTAIEGVQAVTVSENQLFHCRTARRLRGSGYKPFYSGDVAGTGFWLANPQGSGVGTEILDESTNEWRAAKLTEKMILRSGLTFPLITIWAKINRR